MDDLITVFSKLSLNPDVQEEQLVNAFDKLSLHKNRVPDLIKGFANITLEETDGGGIDDLCSQIDSLSVEEDKIKINTTKGNTIYINLNSATIDYIRANPLPIPTYVAAF